MKGCQLIFTHGIEVGSVLPGQDTDRARLVVFCGTVQSGPAVAASSVDIHPTCNSFSQDVYLACLGGKD